MSKPPPPSVQRWSTDPVPQAQRLDYYAAALTAAVDPMHVARGNSNSFGAEVISAELGPIMLVQAKAGGHLCVRDQRDIAHSTERNFHLILNLLSSWTLSHRGEVRLSIGDAVLLDSQFGHEIDLPCFHIVHLKMPELWLRRWVPNPTLLAGRVIRRDSKWGSPLCAFMTQLSPDFAMTAPLPGAVIADHIGALLALIAAEIAGPAANKQIKDRALRDRIQELLTQRCNELSLTAADIATAAHISVRTLHRVLVSGSETFGALLLRARIDLATRMLESAMFNKLTSAEIGRRAGFADASHFSRAYRRTTGRSPLQVRSLN